MKLDEWNNSRIEIEIHKVSIKISKLEIGMNNKMNEMNEFLIVKLMGWKLWLVSTLSDELCVTVLHFQEITQRVRDGIDAWETKQWEFEM